MNCLSCIVNTHTPSRHPHPLWRTTSVDWTEKTAKIAITLNSMFRVAPTVFALIMTLFMWFYTSSPLASTTESLPCFASLVSENRILFGMFYAPARLVASAHIIRFVRRRQDSRRHNDWAFLWRACVILPRRWATVAFSPRKLVMSLF